MMRFVLGAAVLAVAACSPATTCKQDADCAIGNLCNLGVCQPRGSGGGVNGGGAATGGGASTGGGSATGGGTATGGGGGATGGGAGAVTGTRIDRFWRTDGGVDSRAVDLSTALVQVVLDEGDGGFVVLDGTGTQSGTFRVPNVPQGAFFLTVGGQSFVTAERTLELGTDFLGRLNAIGADAGTTLRTTFSNMSPWVVGDDLQAASASSGLFFSSLSFGGFANGQPDAGDTVLLRELDWFSQRAPLVDNTQGDELVVLQLSSRTFNGLRIREASRGLTLNALRMQQGTATPAAGAFTSLTRNSLTFAPRYGDYEVLRSEVHPAAISTGGLVLVSAMAGPSVPIASANRPDLVNVTLPADAGNPSLSLSFGNPFGTEWRPVFDTVASFRLPMSVPLADGGTSAGVNEVVTLRTEAPTSTGAELVVLSPPRALSVDGRVATARLAGVSLTPVIAWTPPSRGAVTTYRVTLNSLVATTAGGTRRTKVHEFVLPGTSTRVQVPPGMLVAATTYFVRVEAWSGGTPFDSARPLLNPTLPVAQSATLSSPFTTR